MMVYVGLDIGGTKFMTAAVEATAVADIPGAILQLTRAPAPENLQEGLDLLIAMAHEAAAGQPIIAIGAAVGGPLDWRTGVVSPLHQPSWRNVHLKALMENTFGCPCYLDVDTNVAALGEYAGSVDKPSRLLYLTLSTGMGGGFLLNGQIYRGAGGAHPEIAHQAIPFRCSHPEQVSCECGLLDCLEGLVSGNAIRRIYGRPAEELDPNEWEEVAYNLGQGLRNLATIYLPDEIFLGGGIAIGGGEAFVKLAEMVMRQHLRLVPPPKVYLSRLGYNTALIGALTLAIRGQRLSLE